MAASLPVAYPWKDGLVVFGPMGKSLAPDNREHMPHARTVEEAEQDLDRVIADAQDAPVLLRKDGATVAVVLSSEAYEMLLSEAPAGLNPRLSALLKKSLIEHARVYRALADWEKEHDR